MFLRRFQKKFLIVLMLALAFPLIAVVVSRSLGPKVIKEPLPSPSPYRKPTKTVSPVIPSSASIPEEINLAIPFTSQAPFGNWELPYNEFCEESSALMVASYVNRQVLTSPDFANQKLLEVKAFEEQKFGDYLDTDAEQTSIILREFYKLPKVKVVPDPTVGDIKKALADGKAVIMPAAGRMLGNPYYRQPGPVYHMLVIKGYTKTGNFITNDPGTRHGADYIYPASVLMKAMHDWNGGDVEHGRKVIIIVG